MATNNVFDMRTGRALFGDEVKHNLQEGMKPYLREDATGDVGLQAVNTVEQVICTAIVAAAVALAIKLANKIAGKITSQPQPPAQSNV